MIKMNLLELESTGGGIAAIGSCQNPNIYIVILRQTVSLYHNSSVWLDT